MEPCFGVGRGCERGTRAFLRAATPICELSKRIPIQKVPSTLPASRVAYHGSSLHPAIAIDARLIQGAGIGTYLRSLLPLLLERMADCRFHLLGRPEEVARAGLAGHPAVRVVPFTAPLYGWQEQWDLARLIPGDTALFWTPNYNFPLAYHGRLIATVHDLIHLDWWHGARETLRRIYAGFMFRRLARRADRIISVSAFTRSRLEIKAGVLGERITVIPNGLQPRWFTVRPAAAAHPRPYILFVGSLKPHKNLAGLIRAFALIAARVPHDLVAIGRRSGLYSMDREAERLAHALPGRVIFAGEVPDAELEQYYLHAVLLALPSFYEGFGFPPLEAMACGCPALVARTTSLPEICGDAAHYVNPADPRDMAEGLLRLLQDEPLRKSLMLRGRERAGRYSWPRCADATAATLRSLLP